MKWLPHSCLFLSPVIQFKMSHDLSRVVSSWETFVRGRDGRTRKCRSFSKTSWLWIAGIDKKKTRQMPFFFVCLYLHNVRSYMAKIFRDEIKSPFAFSHIFLRATRWCWWRQYKNIQSLLGDVVARENIYQSASTWSCWPIINSQCWNVHFFSFKLRCAKTLPKNGFWFNLSFYIKSQRDEDKSTGKLAEAFQGKNWNSSEISIFHGVPFLCVSDQKHFTDLYDMQMTVSSSHANWRTAGQRQIPKSFS